MTETYACQTCFIPITNYFRAFARRWLPISTRLICNQYISQYAPLIRPLSKLAAEKQMHERTVEQGARVKSVYKAMGSHKDHIAYCSIPGATDQFPTCGNPPGFSNIATKHADVCHEAQKIQTSAKSVEISVNPIEPLRYFEPYIRVFLYFTSKTGMISEHRSAAYI